jgi:hypothetical protein
MIKNQRQPSIFRGQGQFRGGQKTKGNHAFVVLT